MLQRFQTETLPQNLGQLENSLQTLEDQLATLPPDSPERAALALDLTLTQNTLALYSAAESLLAASPLLAQGQTSAAKAPAAEGAAPPAEAPAPAADDLAPIPTLADSLSPDLLSAAAGQFGISVTDLENLLDTFDGEIDAINLLANRMKPVEGQFNRAEAGFLRSSSSLKTLSRALLGVIQPTEGTDNRPMTGSAAAIRRTQALLTFLMESRRLEQSNPQLAGRLGLSRLNQAVAGSISRLPSPSLQNILNRYIGNNNRADTADAKQRLADLSKVLSYFSGESDLNLDTGRALFELVLDNGVDTVRGLGELLPAGPARERYEQMLNRIENRIQSTVQRLGSEAPSFLRGLVNSSPEASRYVLRFLTEDGVGRYAAAVDLVGTFAESEIAQRFLGAGGQRNLQALTEFLSLDNIGRDYLRKILDSNAPAGSRFNALNNLVRDIVKDKLPGLSALQVQSFESLTGRALDRFAGLLGLGNAADAARAADDVLPAAARAASDALPDAAGLIARQSDELIQGASLTRPARAGLERLLGASPARAQEVLDVLKTMDPRQLDTVLQIAAEMEPARALNMVVGEGMGARFLRGVAEMVPYLRSYGLRVADIVPKLGRALGKAVPAIGAALSGYDTVRMGRIALTGSYNGRQYSDPDVRMLALAGAATNGLDTVLGALEAFGVGNVAFPLQLGLAGASLALDLMVEYYNDNPQAMPPAMRQAIQYSAATVAVTAPFVVPGAGIAASEAIVSIYGRERTAEIFGELVSEVGDRALDALSDLGQAGLAKLQALATAGGELGLAAVRQLASMGEQGIAVLKDLVLQGGQMADAALNAIVRAARNQGAAAREALLSLARQAGAIGSRAIEQLGSLRDWGAEQLKNLVAAGIPLAQEAISRLSSMGQAGFEALESLVKSGGQFAQQAFNALLAQGNAAIDQLKDIALSGARLGRQAFDALINKGRAAIDALQEIGTRVSAYAGEVITKLSNLGEAAEAAITAIGTRFSQYADEAISGLRRIGARAVDSIQALARRYPALRSNAIRAFAAIGPAASRALNTLIDQMWAAVQTSVNQLMGLANELGAVSSRVLRNISTTLSRGWQRSTIDLIPFNGRETNLRPLIDAFSGLLRKAGAAGSQAYRQMRQLAMNALRDLGVPLLAIRALQRVV
ncbi:MAG: hypothetical protein IGS03_12680 [Candidatus Sericytochromatia bacterium]|nr:hypothetical protein [Candidatus Sericytochromatia bacterium]